MPGLQAALPTGDIEGCADANNAQVITVTSIVTDDFEASLLHLRVRASLRELCAARARTAHLRTRTYAGWHFFQCDSRNRNYA